MATPIGEFTGQIFIDSLGIQWVFNAETQTWNNVGRVQNIPLADETQAGLLRKEDKGLLDKISYHGGGYAIIVNPLSGNWNTRSTPDGVLFGDVELVSETLDIRCVFGDGKEITDERCARALYSETDINPPGFDINLSTKFFNASCIEVRGGPGPKGAPGSDGDPGEDGTGDGPQGELGDPGEDADVLYRITGHKIVELDDVFDTAVVNVELQPSDGKLFVTRSKVRTTQGRGSAADQMITHSIERGIKFIDSCFKYDLTGPLIPCGAANEFDVLDPVIGYYPIHFNANNAYGEEIFQVARKRLSNLVDDIIAYYQGKLDSINAKYNDEIRTYIEAKDKEARMILDGLAEKLSECNNTPIVDFCISRQGSGTGTATGSGTSGATVPEPSDGSMSVIISAPTQVAVHTTALLNITFANSDVINLDNVSVIFDTVPTPLSVVSVSKGTFDSSTGNWVIGTVAAGKSQQLILSVTPTNTGEFTFTVFGGPNSNGATDTIVMTVV